MDHHPLSTILGPKKGITPNATARSQRRAMQLAAKHGNVASSTENPRHVVYNTHQIATPPTSCKEVGQVTR